VQVRAFEAGAVMPAIGLALDARERFWFCGAELLLALTAAESNRRAVAGPGRGARGAAGGGRGGPSY
jgi:hypothetical protein